MTGAGESARTAERESHFSLATGLRLHVVEWGDPAGWPVLILHGGAHDARTWEAVCRQLPSELRCIVPDQRGHGESEWSVSGDYSCASQVDDLVSLLEQLDVVRCSMVGHSMGGLNALLLAGRHPERVDGLVLIDVGTESRDTGLRRVRRPPRELEPTHFDIRLLDHVPTYCGDAEQRRALLLAANTPLLVLRGEHSRILSRESASLTAELGGGEMIEIPDTGHDLPHDNPIDTARALAGFLER